MVVSLYTILLLAISAAVHNLYRSNGYTIAQSYEIDQARRGLQNLVSDAKEMSYSDDGTFPVAEMEPHLFGFYSDVDNDPSVEYVEYELSSTTLYKRVYNASGYPPVYNYITPSEVFTISEYVQNQEQGTPTFLYFDNAGTLLSATSSLLTDVRYIETRVIVNIDPVRSPGEFLLRGGVAPRNLKDNL
jgi:hypothetical protein